MVAGAPSASERPGASAAHGPLRFRRPASAHVALRGHRPGAAALPGVLGKPASGPTAFYAEASGVCGSPAPARGRGGGVVSAAAVPAQVSGALGSVSNGSTKTGAGIRATSSGELGDFVSEAGVAAAVAGAGAC